VDGRQNGDKRVLAAFCTLAHACFLRGHKSKGSACGLSLTLFHHGILEKRERRKESHYNHCCTNNRWWTLGHWVASIGQTDDVVGQSGVLTLRLVGIKEVASYVGLSVHTMYAILSQRRIPYVKVGRLTKFDVRAIDAWIRKN